MRIGKQLDADIFPCVTDGGFVRPSDNAVPENQWATKENDHERSRSRRPEPRPRTRPAGWQRTSGRARTSHHPSQIVCEDLRITYEDELPKVLAAYPGTLIWRQPEGIWLLSESRLVREQGRKAMFLTGIPYVREADARAWGFWSGIPLSDPVWIGPRHTNHPDGSVCAFEPSDGTWMPGGSIVELLDIYACWAVRQLYLLSYGRWPGRQVLHHAFERVVETRDCEYCGCGSNVRYAECCKPMDLDSVSSEAVINYALLHNKSRRPPGEISRFVVERRYTPMIKQYCLSSAA